MGLKDKALKEFQKTPDRYWKVNLFDREGYERKQCSSCKKFFWTLQHDKRVCEDPPCVTYSFIGEKVTKKSFSYIESWDAIKKFFVENDHVAINRYPVICRWFPGLYFTIASIVDFMREEGGVTVFDMPAEKVIVPQMCMRFNDIPNIGVSGRHMSGFTMVGQHTIYDGKKGYWKDECIDLDYQMLTEVFGIPKEEIIWNEDVWVGPSAFGSSLEYFVRGLEVGNAVFTEFLGTIDNYTTMKNKVIDMGAGLERFAWLSQGTPTVYDAVFGPVVEDMKKHVDYDVDFYNKYAKLSGVLNADETDIIKAKAKVAKQLGLSTAELHQKTENIEAIYAICDHARTMAFAITDGGLPSNVGGGYNLRVITRRAFELIEKYNLDFELADIAEAHAKYLKPIYPLLAEHTDGMHEILAVEKQKYARTKDKNRRFIQQLVSKQQNFTTNDLVPLYESKGISPELIEAIGREEGKEISTPDNFYIEMTATHNQEKKEKVKETLTLEGHTRKLYYEQPYMQEFDAKVLDNINHNGKNWVILDQTAFYPEGGGQDHDLGTLDGEKINNVQKVNDVAIHQVDKKLSGKVQGKLDWGRRVQHRAHHTATHLINAAARDVIGQHVWQAGAHKAVDKAHIDLTHYDNLTDVQLKKIEKLINQWVEQKIKVNHLELPRQEAEDKYGFQIYQGGASPGDTLRIIDIEGVDDQACGGTHVLNTEEIGPITIINSERIQDGITRVTFAAGKAAFRVLEHRSALLDQASELLGVSDKDVPVAAERLLQEWRAKRKQLEGLRKEKASSAIDDLVKEIKRIGKWEFSISKINNADMNYLREVSKKLGHDKMFLFLIGISDKIYIFSSTGKDLLEHGVNSGMIVREMCQKLKGAGGGPPTKGEGTVPLEAKEKVEWLYKQVEDKIMERLK